MLNFENTNFVDARRKVVGVTHKAHFPLPDLQFLPLRHRLRDPP